MISTNVALAPLVLLIVQPAPVYNCIWWGRWGSREQRARSRERERDEREREREGERNEREERGVDVTLIHIKDVTLIFDMSWYILVDHTACITTEFVSTDLELKQAFELTANKPKRTPLLQFSVENFSFKKKNVRQPKIIPVCDNRYNGVIQIIRPPLPIKKNTAFSRLARPLQHQRTLINWGDANSQ